MIPMTRTVAKTLAIALIAASLAACTGAPGSKENGGTLVGAALGGLMGSQIGNGRGQLAAVAVGTLMGAFLGREVGQSLDRADRLYARRAATRGLEHNRSGASTTWSNPDSGHHGSFTPVRTYRKPSGRYCREYQQTVTVGGRTEQAYGTACRQPDGSWQIVNGSRV
jgi:surface antigen